MKITSEVVLNAGERKERKKAIKWTALAKKTDVASNNFQWTIEESFKNFVIPVISLCEYATLFYPVTKICPF